MSDSNITMTRTNRERDEAAHPARRRWRVIGNTIGILYCLCCLLAGTVFGNLLTSDTWRQLMRDHGVGIIRGGLTGDFTADWRPSVQFPGRNTINVLVLGSDHDYDNKARVMKTHGRSDSILIAHIDFARGTIGALTIPRDTAINIPGRRGLHKINAAHAFGGPELTIETIRQAFGIPIDGYITIDTLGFVKVVDALGGIDLTVEKRLKYDDNWGKLHINLYPGYQHLTGYQAMGYVRMRHSDSDEMRSKRQHNFLMVLRDKIKSLEGFRRLPAVMDAVSESLNYGGDMSRDKALTLANFARGLNKPGNIVVETLPSEEGRSYVSVKVDDATQTIERIFFDGRPGSVSLDVPERGTVDSMNGGGGRSRRSRTKTAATPPVQPGGELGVEGGADGSGGASGSEGGGTRTDEPPTATSPGATAPRDSGPPPVRGELTVE